MPMVICHSSSVFFSTWVKSWARKTLASQIFGGVGAKVKDALSLIGLLLIFSLICWHTKLPYW